MEHSFNTSLAVKIGIEESIVVNNFFFWIYKNKANEKHFHEGRYWTYNSNKAFAVLFPYMSKSKVFRVLKHLEEENILVKGNFNKDRRDRTCWYAFTDYGMKMLADLGYHLCRTHKVQNEEMHIPKMKNASSQNEPTIPYINNTDKEKDITSVISKKDAAKAATLARKNKFYESLVPFVGKYPKEMIRAFFDYWAELNKSGTKMRFELQKTWEVSLRLATWASREKMPDKTEIGIVLKDNSVDKYKNEKGW